MDTQDRDYIPYRDADFIQWSKQFAQVCQERPGECGLSPEDVAKITEAKTSSGAAYAEHLRGKDAARGLKAAKDAERKDAERVFRTYSRIIQARPETTDALRALLGLPIPDRIRTRQSPEAILQITPPMIVTECLPGGIILVHCGPNPLNEHENALPRGVRGMRLFARIGEGPESFLAEVVRSPFPHPVPGGVPVVVTYRAAYFDRAMRLGPLGQPVRGTVIV
jgi:hypothetical protein